MLDHIWKFTTTDLTDEQLERAAAVFILEGSSFAVSQRVLYMSKTSMEFFKLRNEFILHGENGPL